MFHSTGDHNTKICGGGSIKCYKAAEKKLSTSSYARAFRAKCNCLPTCTTIEYNAEIDRVKFDAAAMNKTETNETK